MPRLRHVECRRAEEATSRWLCSPPKSPVGGGDGLVGMVHSCMDRAGRCHAIVSIGMAAGDSAVAACDRSRGRNEGAVAGRSGLARCGELRRRRRSFAHAADQSPAGPYIDCGRLDGFLCRRTLRLCRRIFELDSEPSRRGRPKSVRHARSVPGL